MALSAAAAAAAWALSRKGRSHIPRVSDLLLPSGAPEPRGEGSIQFIGTATTIIRYGGFTILTDPNFLHCGEQVHIGYGMHSTRLTDPAIDFEQLPDVDFVLLSHLHEDHFDKFVQERMDRSMPVITTGSAAGVLRRKGFRGTFALDTWDAVEVRKDEDIVRVTSMPGTHGPMLVRTMLPSVMGSMLEFRHGGSAAPDFRLYISGDTLIFNDLKEIPRRYPDIHLALLHLGGTRVLGMLVTMDAEQGVRALRIVAPQLAIPIHYNDYDVFKSPLDDFRLAATRAGLGDRVRYLSHGDTFRFAATPQGIKESAGEVRA
jgi:L-ascorbate metabolism protein UlaG (beta-lactamase superfamily)